MAMIKKLAFVLILILAMLPRPVCAQASLSIQIEQASACMPDITATVYLKGMDLRPVNAAQITPGDVSAFLESEPLQITDVRKGSDSQEGICFLFLIDASRSVPKDVFARSVQSISGLIKGMRENDRVAVISFGENIELVSSGIVTPAEALDVLNKIENKAGSTKLYQAIERALALSTSENESVPARRVIIAATDGKDVFAAGITKTELLQNLKNTSVPLYTVGIGNCPKQSKVDMGELSRASGGGYLEAGTGLENDAFTALMQDICSAFTVKMRAKNNIADLNMHMLSIKITDKNTTLSGEIPLRLDQWTPDNVPPEAFVLFLDSKTLAVTFSEDVSGAGETRNYMLESAGRESLSPRSVQYNTEEKIAVLVFEKNLHPGDSILKFNDIADVSMEKNKMIAQGMPVSIPGQQQNDIVPVSGSKTDWFSGNLPWVIALGCILLAGAAAAVILVLRAKKRRTQQAESINTQAEDEFEKRHIIQRVKGLAVKLAVTDAKDNIQEIDMIVKGRKVLGRSDRSDIYFDDTEMSREHCAITARGEGLFIEDLGSTNGTWINGVRIGEPRRLNNGDKAEIGQTRITFSF